MYVEIPRILTEDSVIQEFGADAYRFYQSRIEERKRNGRIYHNPLKTIYIYGRYKIGNPIKDIGLHGLVITRVENAKITGGVKIMAKHNVRELDAGQLQTMWDFLKLWKRNTCTKEDVRQLKEHLDTVRQALVQKRSGRRKGDPKNYVDFEDVGTYINFVVVDALQLYVHGGLDKLEEVLPDER